MYSSCFCSSFIFITFYSIAFAKPSSRIYNGKNANIGQFPHQVALLANGEFFCGGSIVSLRCVLTAAHCVVAEENGIDPYPAELFTVRAGSIQRMAGGALYNVKKIIVNSKYQSFLNDIALLELEEHIVFDENTNKIDLFDGEVPVGVPVIVSGWGYIPTSPDFPHRLQYATLKALGTEMCGKAIDYGYQQIICLEHDNDNGICQGDSGGPAIYQDKLVGVAAFTFRGCGGNDPDGFVNISYWRKWILQNMIQ